MTYNLLRESWIPWRRRSGIVEWGPPAALVSRIDEDPVVGLSAPRPDFDGALQEFLIGLLTVALVPEDEEAWRALWDAPPSVESLQLALESLPPAFDLDGDGPRFFQDLSSADFNDVEPGPIDQILIETPGDQTLKLNKDLFVKRDRVQRFGRPVATMALITIQTYAPAGGQGHRTSLRGGGPLTTLVDPRVDSAGGSRAHDQPLWRKLWANVETKAQWANRVPPGYPASPAHVFPWLAPARSSNDKQGGRATTPLDAHPLQAYFGLPRRIRLEFGGAGRCDFSALTDERTVTGFRMRNYGVQYVGWRHPLTPYYRQKTGDEWLPLHGQPGGIGWRDWLTLTLRAPEGQSREPARTVAAFGKRAASVGVRQLRIHAFGYDMDNMKARGWTEALLPAFAADADRQALLFDVARGSTDAAGMSSTALFGAVKSGLFQSAENAGGDLGQVRQELWGATESAFYDIVNAVSDPTLTIDAAEDVGADQLRAFAPILLERSTAIFDRWCPVSGLASAALRRRVTARYNLVSTLKGYSKLGQKIFESLRIAPPNGGHGARASTKARTRKEASK